MLISKAARRYANALLEIGKERNEVEDLLEDMQFINNTMEDSRDLIVFLRSPVINFDDKQAVLLEIFGDKIEEVTKEFLKLLTRKNRVNLLHQIARAYIERYNKYAGIIEVSVAVARSLKESQKEALLHKLEEITSKKVRLTVNVDESLKGGMAVRIDDTVIDGTVKHKLRELEEQLLATAVE